MGASLREAWHASKEKLGVVTEHGQILREPVPILSLEVILDVGHQAVKGGGQLHLPVRRRGLQEGVNGRCEQAGVNRRG